jgi:glycosyltransferase involved in cell wall biosynthesis
LKRICITINFFPFSGGARAIVNEVWRALHEDYEIHFLTIPPLNYPSQYLIHPLQKARRHFVPCNPGLFPLTLFYELWGVLRLLQLNKKYRFTVILTQDGVFTGFYSAIVGKLTKTRVVVMDYGATTNYLSSDYWNFRIAVKPAGLRILLDLHTLLLRYTALIAIKVTVKLSDKLAILGHELSEIYHQMNVPESKLRIIQYSVDENFYSPSKKNRAAGRLKWDIPDENVVVNTTCRLSQEKGIQYLMPALKQAVESDDRIVCLVVGMGKMYNFASHFVKENNLEQKIRLMGDASPGKVRELLQISDIFVYAGVTGSNVSLAVLEAMATGCAVIATNSPRSHENLLANKRGMIIPVKDTNAMARSIMLLTEDAELRRLMSENARKWVVENYSLQALKESTEALLVS